MDAREIAATVVVPVAVGLVPWLLEKAGVTVPNWVITSGGVLTIGGLCFGLFHLVSWTLEKLNLFSPETRQSGVIPYVLSFSVAAVLITLWLINPKHDLTKFPPKILEVVSGKTYIGGMVEIDGKRFENCTFQDVTLMYHGTDTYSIIKPTWTGSVYLRTDNKAIHDFWELYKEITKLKAASIKVYEVDANGNPRPMN